MYHFLNQIVEQRDEIDNFFIFLLKAVSWTFDSHFLSWNLGFTSRSLSLFSSVSDALIQYIVEYFMKISSNFPRYYSDKDITNLVVELGNTFFCLRSMYFVLTKQLLQTRTWNSTFLFIYFFDWHVLIFCDLGSFASLLRRKMTSALNTASGKRREIGNKYVVILLAHCLLNANNRNQPWIPTKPKHLLLQTHLLTACHSFVTMQFCGWFASIQDEMNSFVRVLMLSFDLVIFSKKFLMQMTIFWFNIFAS